MIPEINRLRRAIRDLRGVESTYLRSEPVHETFRGETEWEGVVEVIALKGDPKAGLAYAWSPGTDEGGATSGSDPIKTARDAVRASIAAESRIGREKN